jgi:signal transduction histidine kinase/ActR/RegA family two-component response regulator
MAGHVLVVDDEESVKVTLCGVLERSGYRAEGVSSVDDAIARLDTAGFDALILDLVVGADDGLRVLDRVREIAPDTPVVILSGHGTLETAARALRLGAAGYFVKPTAVEDLIAAVDRSVERRQTLLAERREREDERAQLFEEAKRARAAAEALAEQRGFLAEVSAALASSLDYATTVGKVTQLAVPYLADLCFAYLQADDGRIRRLAVANVDPARQELSVELDHRFPVETYWAADDQRGMAAIIARGRSELVAEVDESVVGRAVPNSEYRQVVQTLSPRSYMGVPLIARDRVLGAMVFLITTSSRRYGQADLALAEDLARRCALAIENALLYQSAQAAIRARDDFLVTAAHELKTPLTGLRSSVQLLQRVLDRSGNVDPDRLHRMLGIADQQTRRLASLVNQLLDVSAIESGQLHLDRKSIDVLPIARRAAALAERRSALHRVEVSATGPTVGTFDPGRIEQVLTYLLDNAVKYSPRGGSIELAVQGDAQTLALTIADRGLGIPPDRRDHLFDRYYQAHADDYLSGLGLSLYLARQIVELHGGTLGAEFPASGETRFVVRLPIGRSPSPPTPLPPGERGGRNEGHP